MSLKPVTIIGGGLAGLTLGIQLRTRGVPVTLQEAGQYPRHRVCGEFLSGQGVEVLREMGVYDRALAAGARPAETAKFFSGTRETQVMRLPAPALCVSRYRLDQLLAGSFQEAGGHLLTGSRYMGGYGEGVVRATGRQVQTEVEGWRWIGIKVHALGLELEADLEMHLGPDAYVGLCRVEDNRVNVCGLFRSKTPIPDLKDRWLDLVSGETGSALTKKLSNISFDKSSVSVVAGLPIRPFQNGDTSVLSVGDGVAMIPPVTGNGMSLAMESARQAAARIEEFSRGRRDWTEIQGLVYKEYVQRYGGRLRWAGWLQSSLFHPLTRGLLMRSVGCIPGLFGYGFRVTRD